MREIKTICNQGMRKRIAKKIMKRFDNSFPKGHNYTSEQIVKAYYRTHKKIVWSGVIIPNSRYQLPQKTSSKI